MLCRIASGGGSSGTCSAVRPSARDGSAVWPRPSVGGTCGSRCATRSCEPSSPPTYQPMCKRQVMAGRFYRSVQQPGVEVFTDAIDRIEPLGIVTADGNLHELDLLVYA